MKTCYCYLVEHEVCRHRHVHTLDVGAGLLIEDSEGSLPGVPGTLIINIFKYFFSRICLLVDTFNFAKITFPLR